MPPVTSLSHIGGRRRLGLVEKEIRHAHQACLVPWPAVGRKRSIHDDGSGRLVSNLSPAWCKADHSTRTSSAISAPPSWSPEWVLYGSRTTHGRVRGPGCRGLFCASRPNPYRRRDCGPRKSLPRGARRSDCVLVRGDRNLDRMAAIDLKQAVENRSFTACPLSLCLSQREKGLGRKPVFILGVEAASFQVDHCNFSTPCLGGLSDDQMAASTAIEAFERSMIMT